jgi:hypothetical protein
LEYQTILVALLVAFKSYPYFEQYFQVRMDKPMIYDKFIKLSGKYHTIKIQNHSVILVFTFSGCAVDLLFHK